MKKIIIAGLVMGGVILFFSAKEISVQTHEIFPITHKGEVSQVEISGTSNWPLAVSTQKEKVIEAALDEARTTESFESALKNLSEKEVLSRLKSTEKILDDSNLFQIANSEEGLNAEGSKNLIELMRMKQALNIILLNRHLEEMRRKYL